MRILGFFFFGVVGGGGGGVVVKRKCSSHSILDLVANRLCVVFTWFRCAT